MTRIERSYFYCFLARKKAEGRESQLLCRRYAKGRSSRSKRHQHICQIEAHILPALVARLGWKLGDVKKKITEDRKPRNTVPVELRWCPEQMTGQWPSGQARCFQERLLREHHLVVEKTKIRGPG